VRALCQREEKIQRLWDTQPRARNFLYSISESLLEFGDSSHVDCSNFEKVHEASKRSFCEITVSSSYFFDAVDSYFNYWDRSSEGPIAMHLRWIEDHRFAIGRSEGRGNRSILDRGSESSGNSRVHLDGFCGRDSLRSRYGGDPRQSTRETARLKHIDHASVRILDSSRGISGTSAWFCSIEFASVCHIFLQASHVKSDAEDYRQFKMFMRPDHYHDSTLANRAAD
jgi:hypothetical protein